MKNTEDANIRDLHQRKAKIRKNNVLDYPLYEAGKLVN